MKNNLKKISMLFILGVTLNACDNNGGSAARNNVDNYGQYDKGTPMCDEGAYGDVNNLCE